MNNEELKEPGWYWLMSKTYASKWLPVEVRFRSYRQIGDNSPEILEFWDPSNLKWKNPPQDSNWEGPISNPS